MPKLVKTMVLALALAAGCGSDESVPESEVSLSDSITALPRKGYSAPSIPLAYGRYIADATSGSWKLRVVASIETAGIHLSSSTVDATVTKMKLWYRPSGGSWVRGHDFSGRITKTLESGSDVSHQPLELYVSSLFELAPDTQYEVKAELSNNANQIVRTLTKSFRTQPDVYDFTPVHTLVVDKAGGPYTTIQSAIDAATPGTRILVKPGVYYESLELTTSGGPDGAFIQILGDGPGVVLDGSYPDNAAAITASWQQYQSSSAVWGSNLWKSNVAGDLWAIWMNDVSLFRHVDTSYTPSGMSAFLNASSGHLNDGCPCDAADNCPGEDDPYGNELLGTPKHRVPEGFYTEAGKIYLRLAAGKTPGGQTFHVSKRPVGIHLDDVDWIWIEGLTVRYFGNASSFTGAIRIDNGSYNIIRNNDLSPNRSGVIVSWDDTDADKRADDGAAFNRIEQNHISTSIRYSDNPDENYLSYCQTKKGANMVGVQIGGSVGNVVRGNTIDRIGENSIQLQISTGNQEHLGGCSDEAACPDLFPWLLYDTDVYDNTIENNVEGLELDGGQVVNARVFRNRLVNMELYLLSLQAGQYGPTFMVRNEWIRPPTSPFVRFESLKYRYYERHRYVRFYHNTVANFKAGQTAAYSRKNLYEYTPTVFRNNLFYARGTAAKFIDYLTSEEEPFREKPDMDYDSYGSDSATVARWQKSDGGNLNLATVSQLQQLGLEPHGRFAAPGFVDASALDVSLVAASANVDAGVLVPGINAGFIGAAPDIGAREHGAIAPGPNELILDDADAETVAVGGWSPSSAPGPYASGSVYAKGSGKTFTFPFELDGKYRVYAWWTEWPSRATNVPVIIFHSGGIATVPVNQRQDGSQWNLIGTYTFSKASGTSAVRVSTDGSLATESVCADAVRLVRVP
jgi:hypothetical protein